MSWQLAKLLEDYREKRVHMILENPPVPLKTGPFLSLHVLPHGFFDEFWLTPSMADHKRAITELHDGNGVRPICGRAIESSSNVDGVLFANKETGECNDCHGFIQVIQNRAMESVTTRNIEDPRAIRKSLNEVAPAYRDFLVALGSKPPFYFLLSAARMQGVRVLDKRFSFSQDKIVVPPVRVKERDLVDLKPAIDNFYQAAGMLSAP